MTACAMSEAGLIVKTVPDVGKSPHVVVARLRDLVNVFVEGDGVVQSNTKKFAVSDRGIVEGTLM